MTAAVPGVCSPCGGVALGGTGSVGAVWALTVLTDASTPCAAATVNPALVRPPTKPRRDIWLFKYFTTSSLMIVSFEFANRSNERCDGAVVASPRRHCLG